MSESNTSGRDATESPHACNECGSIDTEQVETDTTLGGDFIRRFSCNDCYAGFEVEYCAVSKKTYHPPDPRARSES